MPKISDLPQEKIFHFLMDPWQIKIGLPHNPSKCDEPIQAHFRLTSSNGWTDWIGISMLHDATLREGSLIKSTGKIPFYVLIRFSVNCAEPQESHYSVNWDIHTYVRNREKYFMSDKTLWMTGNTFKSTLILFDSLCLGR